MCDIVWWCFWGLMISMMSLLCIWSVLCVLFLFLMSIVVLSEIGIGIWEGAKAIRLEKGWSFFFCFIGYGL